MLVGSKNYRTIEASEDQSYVKIIDQTLLPFKFKIIHLKTLDGVVMAIKNMQVRGAPLIMPSIDALIPVCIAFSAFCYFKHLRVSGLWKIVYLFSSVLCTAPLFARGKAVFCLAFFLFVVPFSLSDTGSFLPQGC